jgi:phospholipase D1/2
VHAKIMVVDDVLLRVGSSNLNNRSMGLDTECDLIIEADPDSAEDAPVRAAIRSVRADLLAEHMGRDVETVTRKIDERRSVIAAIEALNASQGRRLCTLDPPALSDAERAVVESRILDPERSSPLGRRVRRLARRWRAHKKPMAGHAGSTP